MTIPERQEELNRLYREFFGDPSPNDHDGRRNGGTAGTSKLTDQAVLEKMFAEADKGEQWRATYRGDYANYYPSPSEAVATILRKAAFYSNNDPMQMERIIRGSGLSSPKFDSRRNGSTWLAEEIAKAIADTPEPYQSTVSDGACLNLSSSASPLRENDDDRSDEVPGLICFANKAAPDPVDFFLERAAPPPPLYPL